ncbi:MAG TPA: methyltransferase domain-containing protein [Solirubrobacteraceae bacterium]|nr:methyltransferase domain-containing protein [Solirubrobacteraceae bacterium]
MLDASCGIGTQAIGLARAGFTVTATDISPVSVERCAREAAAAGGGGHHRGPGFYQPVVVARAPC